MFFLILCIKPVPTPPPQPVPPCEEVLHMADPECLAMWNNLRLGYTETAGLPVRGEDNLTAELLGLV